MTAENRHGRPVRIGEVLAGVLAGSGLQERLRERRLLEAWPAVVGPRVARHSRAVDLEDGVLLLQADHPVWRQELVLLFPQIKAKYDELFGPGRVQEIRWDHRRPGPRSGRRPPDQER